MRTLTFDNGDQMPALGLGTWKSAPGEVYGAVKEAIRLGYRHVDCAAIYQNEAEVGRALSECLAEGLVTRDELWITSKLWNNAHAPEDVEPALRETLTRLQLERLDLYLIHWPVAQRKETLFPRRGSDLLSLEARPLEATWAAMAALREAGLARHIGVSNFNAAKLAALMKAGPKPELNQVELHPYLQQAELVSFCREAGIHLTAYSPLGSPDRPAGLKSADEPALLDNPVLAEIGAARGATPAQVLLAWALHRGTSTIPKSVNPARLAQNLAAASVTLTPEDMARIEALELGWRYVTGAFWALRGSPYTVEGLWGG